MGRRTLGRYPLAMASNHSGSYDHLAIAISRDGSSGPVMWVDGESVGGWVGRLELLARGCAIWRCE